jgi:alpha-tubulin suppressor-like RCC1 family protein
MIKFIILIFSMIFMFSACSVEVEEGKFSCDPNSLNSCPDDFKCTINTEISTEYMCYKNTIEEFCGNSTLEADEHCDGDESRVYDSSNMQDESACRFFGYWGGDTECTDYCQYELTTCNSIEKFQVGAYHFCGIDNEKTIWCWGDNSYGQLGDGKYETNFHPQQVIGNRKYLEISSGDFHNCTINDASQIMCWGDNTYGQLGTHNNNNYIIPTPVYDVGCTPENISNCKKFYSVEAGGMSSCAIDAGGLLYCWGLLPGDSTETYHNIPEPMVIENSPDTVFVQVSISNSFEIEDFDEGILKQDHICVITEDSSLFCTGNNNFGQVGISSNASMILEFKQVKAGFNGEITQFRTVKTGVFHTCAIDINQKIWCWGYNDYLALGNNVIDSTCLNSVGYNCSNIPVSPIFLEFDFEAGENGEAGDEIHPNFTKIDTYFHTCAYDTENRVWCWGNGGSGQLGMVPEFRTSGDWEEPCDIEDNCLPVTMDSTKMLNRDYQIGSLHIGQNFSCFLENTGLPWCWGEESYIGSIFEVLNDVVIDLDEYPILLKDRKSKTYKMSAGVFHFSYIPYEKIEETKIIKDSYILGCIDSEENAWYYENDAPMCPYDRENSFPYSKATNYTKLKDISSGRGFTCGITDATPIQIKCIGMNEYGQLGNGTTDDSTESFVEVPVLGAHKVVSGSNHTCALIPDATSIVPVLDGTTLYSIKCWGNNEYGQAGFNPQDATFLSLPIPIMRDATDIFKERIIDITLGSYHTCVLTSAATTYCWGLNENNSLRIDPENEIVFEPKEVFGLPKFESVISGGYYTCGLDMIGVPWCWTGLYYDDEVDDYDEDNLYQIATMNKFTKISGGYDHACGLDMRNDIYCWGENDAGQLGNGEIGSETDIPVKVKSRDYKFSDLECGFGYCCGVTCPDNDCYNDNDKAGDIKCWGDIPFELKRLRFMPTPVVEP